MKASPRPWSFRAEVTSIEAWKKSKYPNGHKQKKFGVSCSAKAKTKKKTPKGKKQSPNQCFWREHIHSLPWQKVNSLGTAMWTPLKLGWWWFQWDCCLLLSVSSDTPAPTQGVAAQGSSPKRDFLGSRGLSEESLIFRDSCYGAT